MALVNCNHCEEKFDNSVDYEGYRTISTPRRYCSRLCEDRQHNRKPPLKRKLMRKCKWCNVRFNAKKGYDGNYTNRPLWYHTPECKLAARKAKNAERYRNRYTKKEKPKKLSWRYRKKSDEQSS